MKSMAEVMTVTGAAMDASAWVLRLVDPEGFRRVSRKRLVRLPVLGRPKGARVRYPGIMLFCKRYGLSHQHVRDCLDGRRPYAGRVQMRWDEWQEMQPRDNARAR
jgi:hypothetical protein